MSLTSIFSNCYFERQSFQINELTSIILWHPHAWSKFFTDNCDDVLMELAVVTDDAKTNDKRRRFARCMLIDFGRPSPYYHGNRTELSSTRSVIIRVINKMGRPISGSPICQLRV